MNWADLLVAASLGFIGSLHCIGMCGSLVGALTWALPPDARQGRRRLFFVLTYNLGRISSYGLIGLIAGWVGQGLSNGEPGIWLRLLASLMLLLLALHLLGVASGLNWLEAQGQKLWRYIKPVSQTLFPIQRPAAAFALGLLWGWLPCGLIYSTLVWAMASGHAGQTALNMLAFGLGTLPALLLAGTAAERLAAWALRHQLKLWAGTAVLLYALWSLYALWPIHGAHSHQDHSPHQPVAEPVMSSPRPDSEPMHHHHHH